MLVFHIFLLHLESSLKISLPTLRLHCSQAWAGDLSTRALLLLEKVGLDHRVPGCVFLRQACWPEGSGAQVKNLATKPARDYVFMIGKQNMS